MKGLFSRIVAGEIPCYKIAEDERFFAFLDINPLAKGHTLVIPKDEIDYILDLDDLLFADLFLFSKRVARALEKVLPCQKIAFSVIGLEVPHAHIHLVPIQKESDLYSKKRLEFSEEEMKEIASSIAQEFKK